MGEKGVRMEGTENEREAKKEEIFLVPQILTSARTLHVVLIITPPRNRRQNTYNS